MKGNYKQTNKTKKKNATIKWVSVDLRQKITTCDINEIILGVQSLITLDNIPLNGYFVWKMRKV